MDIFKKDSLLASQKQSPRERTRKVTEILENDSTMWNLFLQLTTKCEQSTDNQVSTEVEKCNSVVISCNDEVETDNVPNVKQNTSDNVACNEVVMNDDLNTVNSKTCNTQNVVNNAFKVDNNNAFKNQANFLSK